MAEFLSTPLAQITILLTVLAGLATLGLYVLRRFRGGAEEEQPKASEWMTNFRELHTRGGLSDQEYRNIKTLLGDQIQKQLNDNEQQGYNDRDRPGGSDPAGREGKEFGG